MTAELEQEIARIVQDASCRMETEPDDWELGTKGFTWCDVHNCDAQSENPEDYGEVCPKAVETAARILELFPLQWSYWNPGDTPPLLAKDTRDEAEFWMKYAISQGHPDVELIQRRAPGEWSRVDVDPDPVVQGGDSGRSTVERDTKPRSAS